MKHILGAFLLAFALATGAVAQIKPQASVNVSSTITVTNTFQTVFAYDPNRSACLIQNNGSNTMWVFFGPLASATKGASVVLAAGKSVSCISGPVVATDAVSITGTSTDAFLAMAQ